MGLTSKSSGKNLSTELIIKKRTEKDEIIAVAGNPNVGKSSIFNALTGMNQHTGNWPGKTVSNAQGYCNYQDNSYVLVDIPGTYSLFAHSAEEEVARNFICFGPYEKIVIVCDGTCLERNLNLVLQTLEITKNVVVCVNLLDETKRKGIKINLDKLSEKLGVDVVGTIAHKPKTLNCLLEKLQTKTNPFETYKVSYPEIIENSIKILEEKINQLNLKINSRWLSINILLDDKSLLSEISKHIGFNIEENILIKNSVKIAENLLLENRITKEVLKDIIVNSIISSAENICKDVVTRKNNKTTNTDRKLDRIFTSRKFGYPIMVFLLLIIFWITITGANYISESLSFLFTFLENQLEKLLIFLNAPQKIIDFIIDGVYRVPSMVVSVMLPPMAIFFPLFTLLEDSGYLPRIAFNLDRPFKKCNSCGKQALTMCMGFGCNAAGVVGCRIIDSKRERILAILTNSLVPCNGRFPAIIALISMFFITTSSIKGEFFSAFYLTLFILLSVFITFIATKILSIWFLKGEPSSYILELPPYRKPQIHQVIVRSIFDRTLFVLGRSLSVAVPAGMIIYGFANIFIDGQSLFKLLSDFLEPVGELIGLDGVILIAFILGFPANEIVIPLILMGYLGGSVLEEVPNITLMREILITNGWTLKTALCTLVFSLFHWPCSTTVLTIKKESGSIKWTLLSVLFPTVIGAVICFFINLMFNVFI